MKHTSIKLLGVALLATCSACDGLWMQEEVPDAVKERLVELYPNVNNVDWDQEPEGFEAEFELNKLERSVMFGADGSVVRVMEEVSAKALPQQALAHLQTQFDVNQVEEVYRVSEQQKISFVVELEQQNEEVQLVFNEKGELLEQSGAQQAVVQKANLLGTGNTAGNITFTKPVARWEMPSELREISGITLLDESQMACVQDEEGTIFIYDLNAHKVTNKIKFAGPGDYEEIAVNGSTAYVLRSDGAVFEVADFMGQPKVKEHASVLANTQDTEGLAYDEVNNRLLIACKGFDEKLGAMKGIYALDLNSGKMDLEPVIRIPMAQKLLNTAKQGNQYDLLQPSALEVHPETGDLYLLDAENLRMLVLNTDGSIARLVALPKELLPKPEGLAFGNTGAIYIASEGKKKGKGVILKYNEKL